jgi:beta-glucosidase-like glycosyl hydrolase
MTVVSSWSNACEQVKNLLSHSRRSSVVLIGLENACNMPWWLKVLKDNTGFRGILVGNIICGKSCDRDLVQQ